MQIKPRGKIYSINEGYESQWDSAVKQYVNDKKNPQVRSCPNSVTDWLTFIMICANMQTGKAYGARYVGSMVSATQVVLPLGPFIKSSWKFHIEISQVAVDMHVALACRVRVCVCQQTRVIN